MFCKYIDCAWFFNIYICYGLQIHAYTWNEGEAKLVCFFFGLEDALLVNETLK